MDKPSQPSNNKQPEKDVKNWLTYSGMAFEFFGIIAVFTGIGYYLDKKFDTDPILMLILLLVGLFGSFYRIYKQFR